MENVLPSDSVGLNFFQAAQLASVSCRQLVWSQKSSLQLGLFEGLSAFTAYSGKEKPNESGQFREHPEAIVELFAFLFKELLCRMEYFNSRRH